MADSRPSSIVASLRLPPRPRVATVWEWDDGVFERVEEPWAAIVRARRTHRYAEPGVYLVRLHVDGEEATGGGSASRYAVVRAPGQIAASGWIRDPPRGAVPFGYLITPADPLGSLVLRCALPAGELVASELAWLVVGDPPALHFGGSARLGSGAERYPFRVDAALEPSGSGIGRRHVAITVYPPDSVPGRDAPIARVAGPVRPGGVDLAVITAP